MIPQLLHFIILEETQTPECLENIKAWKNLNANFEINLWIDSRMLSPRFFTELMQDAKSLEMELIDVKTIRELNTEVYEKEIGAKERSKNTVKEVNALAGTNLLKTSVLLQHGGVYINHLLKPCSLILDNNEPIFINYDNSEYGLNLDALAVMPDDPIIRHLKYLQEKNLKELYGNPRLLHFYMMDKIGPESTRLAYTQNHTGAHAFVQAVLQYNKSLILSSDFKRRYKLNLSTAGELV